MVLSEAITKVRERSRTVSSALNDTRIMEALNEGMKAFANAVCNTGLHKDEYLTVAPKFTTRTNFAIRITITGGTNALVETDVAITGTDRDDVSGTTVASDLQTALQTAVGVGASITVAWSATNWTFTIDSIDGTAIKIESPTGKTYVDATSIVLGGTSTGTQTLVSGFPVDCTVKISLPSDYLSMDRVEWDNNEVIHATFDFFTSPQNYGDPVFYGIKNKEIFLSPVPSRQKSLKIWYKYQPTVFTDASAQTNTELPIESNYQMAIVYWAAAYVAESNFEDKIADRNLAMYEHKKNEYIITKANENPRIFTEKRERIGFGIDWSTL